MRLFKSNMFISCVLIRFGGDLLSHVLRRSTIGAVALNGRVRDGIGCFAHAVTTKPEKIAYAISPLTGRIAIHETVFRLSYCSVCWSMTFIFGRDDHVITRLLDQIKPIGQLVLVN